MLPGGSKEDFGENPLHMGWLKGVWACGGGGWECLDFRVQGWGHMCFGNEAGRCDWMSLAVYNRMVIWPPESLWSLMHMHTFSSAPPLMHFNLCNCHHGYTHAWRTHTHTHTHPRARALSLARHELMQRKTDRTRRTDLVVVVLVFVVVCEIVGIRALSSASWDKGSGPLC